jgi:hypothetical protein
MQEIRRFKPSTVSRRFSVAAGGIHDLGKRLDLLEQAASLIMSSAAKPAHGGRHDKFFVGGHSVEVPRHTKIVEYTARGILRTFGQPCAEAGKKERP